MEEATTRLFNEKTLLLLTEHSFFRKVDDSGRTIKDTPQSQFIAYTIFKDSS